MRNNGRTAPAPLRIVGFNMRGGGSAGHWLEMIDRLAPDMALVQETRDPRELATQLVPASRLVWEPVEHGKWGTALLLPRRPRRLLPVAGFEGWVVGAEVTAWPRRPRPLHVYSVHVPSRRISYVREANAMLDAIAAQSAGADLVIGGDFNLTVAHRVPQEERRNSRGEQRFLERTESELGLVNSWRAMHSSEPLPQTLRWSRDPVTPYHCDEILVPEAWIPGTVAAAVHGGQPWLRLSDHNPVSVDLGRPPSR